MHASSFFQFSKAQKHPPSKKGRSEGREGTGRRHVDTTDILFTFLLRYYGITLRVEKI